MEDVVMLNRLDKLTPLYSSQDETHWGWDVERRNPRMRSNREHPMNQDVLVNLGLTVLAGHHHSSAYKLWGYQVSIFNVFILHLFDTCNVLGFPLSSCCNCEFLLQMNKVSVDWTLKLETSLNYGPCEWKLECSCRPWSRSRSFCCTVKQFMEEPECTPRGVSADDKDGISLREGHRIRG